MWIPPAYSPIELSGIVRGLFASKEAIPALEASLGEWYEAERAMATASGTQALQLAIRAALDATEASGPVALPAFNCFDLASAAVWVGAPVVFYDIDPMTLAPEPESLAGAAETAAVLVVANLFGFPLDWDLVREVAGARGIPVVEDAAQGLGAEWKGQAAGTFGDLSILSFGRGKGWTGGSGGAALARNGFGSFLPDSLPENPGSRISEALKTTAVWLLARPSLYGIPARIPSLGLGETHYRPPSDPASITPFAAAMVLHGRERALEEVEVRRGNGARLATALRMEGEGGPDAILPEHHFPKPLAEGQCGYLRFPVLGEDASTSEDAPARENAAARLEDHRRGIYRSYPRTLPELEVVEELLVRVEGEIWSGAARLARGLLTLPTHSRRPVVHAGLPG